MLNYISIVENCLNIFLHSYKLSGPHPSCAAQALAQWPLLLGSEASASPGFITSHLRSKGLLFLKVLHETSQPATQTPNLQF